MFTGSSEVCRIKKAFYEVQCFFFFFFFFLPVMAFILIIYIYIYFLISSLLWIIIYLL